MILVTAAIGRLELLDAKCIRRKEHEEDALPIHCVKQQETNIERN